MKVLLIIPPFTQINTPYPATMQLAGFLSSKNYDVESFDLSLVVTLRIFSQEGLRKIFDSVKSDSKADKNSKRIIKSRSRYEDLIDAIVEFLQSGNSEYAETILAQDYLPRGESFENLNYQVKTYNSLNTHDRAKHLCSLVIDDLTKFIRKNVTEHFGLSRYAESIAVSPSKFDPLLSELKRKPNVIEQIIIEETEKIIKRKKPDVVGFTIPFPGNFLGALIPSKFIKERYPEIKIIFGGGYINTELRALKDCRIFDFCDFITYDDGEIPLLNIIKNIECGNLPIESPAKNAEYVRTLVRLDNKLKFIDDGTIKNISHGELTAPSIKGIEPKKYISMLELLNPMHRLWSDGYWNKLTIAHGCYWRKCTFCDITLDYIGTYSPAGATRVVNWIEEMMLQSGSNSFHFTDEAAPPSLLKDISIEILRRKLNVKWWGNIRFEKAFTLDLCKLMSAAGCIAVSGGIEVADDRLLKLINKGITIEQAAAACSNFKNAGIMVHAYLMYGFPTQTKQETINSLDMVRQFMKHGLFQSAYWHLFTLTVHSPIAKDPDKYKINIHSHTDNPFANNNLEHTEAFEIDHKKFGGGLNKALYNYMHGIGLDWDIQDWFDFPVIKSTVKKNYIGDILVKNRINKVEQRFRSVWIGDKPELVGNINGIEEIKVRNNFAEGTWELNESHACWLNKIITRTMNSSVSEPIRYFDWAQSFPGATDEFEDFIRSEVWKELREHFLLFV